MNRIGNFTLRVNTIERRLIAAVAERLDRTESDTMRHLLREKARELGVTPQDLANLVSAASRETEAAQ